METVQPGDAKGFQEIGGAVADGLSAVAKANTPKKPSPIEELLDHLKKNSDLGPTDSVRIMLGRKTVYDSSETNPMDLTPGDEKKLKVLSEGGQFERGSVRIYKNGEQRPAYQRQGDKELINAINYKTGLQQSNPTPTKQNPIAQKTDESLTAQITQLQKQLSEVLQKQSETEQRLAKLETRQLEVANPKLSQWLNGVKESYVSHLNGVKQNLKDRVNFARGSLQKKVEEGQSYVKGKVQEGTDAVRIKVQEGRDTVQKTIDSAKLELNKAWLNTVVKPSLDNILNQHGKNIGDNTHLRTQKYAFTRHEKTGDLQITRIHDGSQVTPANLNAIDQKVLGAVAEKGAIAQNNLVAKGQLNSPGTTVDPKKQQQSQTIKQGNRLTPKL